VRKEIPIYDSLDQKHFSGTFTMTVKAVVAKPNGDAREETLEVVEVASSPGSPYKNHIVKATENGKDVTAERQRKEDERAREEAVKTKRAKPEKEEGLSLEVRVPAGEDLTLFEFGPAKEEGDLLVAPFSPLAQHRKGEGIAEDRLAWRKDTLDPVWIEAKPITMPSHVSEMAMRFELGRTGDLVYAHRTVTDGLGGVLWIKRRFHLETAISHVRPSSAPSPTPPPAS
jgi:hypothetical protein